MDKLSGVLAQLGLDSDDAFLQPGVLRTDCLLELARLDGYNLEPEGLEHYLSCRGVLRPHKYISAEKAIQGVCPANLSG